MDPEHVAPHIAASARRHGGDDQDILHAARNPIRSRPQDAGLVMLVGPRRDGQLLEVGVVVREDRITIVHAMLARAKHWT